MTRIGAVALTANMGVMLALVGGVVAAPASAFPFSNCDQAEAAGAAPIYAGQPGYSSDLDRDGDGVACEQGVSSGPVALAPPVGATYLTTIVWNGTQCIEAVVPNFTEMLRQTFCSPDEGVQFHHTAAPGQLVGADPIMGAATSMSCSVITYTPGPDLIRSTAVAGDGTDVNCLVTV
jgi:hypothetical protein